MRGVGPRIRHSAIWYVLAGTRGGASRARIVRLLMTEPRNANQLAEALGMDYSTIQHHLDVLERNGIAFPSGARYGRTFQLTPRMRDALPSLASIWEKLDENKDGSGG